MSYGLYFLDVLACLLFSITLALAGARFGREHHVGVDLPELAAAESRAAGVDGLDAPQLTLRSGASGPELFLDGERVALDELGARLRAAPPPVLVVRSEGSALGRVIGVVHAAGVPGIQLAYEATDETAPVPDAAAADARSGDARERGAR